ncbi:helix-turn-helix domain-containing protein [Seonamhaeicola sp.]|uniref:helix-turn-helix domain-containing protein n=1 Tax=Seonamhaeicola sp. TaxID=1912245 RepID=UPI0026197C2B|nr:helix-turn-helix domain-containing protein [Seonamhaeicola sp.]
MKTDIPQISFKSSVDENFGFEIVPLKRIAANKKSFKVNPEKPHQLKFYNLIFITQGESKHFVDFKWYPIQKNSLIYLTKDQINAFCFTDTMDGFCIIFTEAYFANSFSHLPEDFVFRLFNPQLFSPILQIPLESEFHNYFNLLYEESVKKEGFNKETIVKALFVILISKAEQLKQHQTFHVKNVSKINLFQKFASLLERNFAKTRSADTYAKELAITYKHLNAVCKALVNKTAKSVIDDYIILQAKRNLINSDIKVNELAYKLGFEDPTNFNKYFKKSTGLTPKSFKNNYK